MTQHLDEALTTQVAIAFTDLGLRPTDKRQESFFHLGIQYANLEIPRVCQKVQLHMLDVSAKDIFDYTAMTFIQHYGQQLWPNRYAAHQPYEFVAARDQDCRDHEKRE